MDIYHRNELTCKPLDTYSEVLTFLQNPPAWRSLCRELTPHSELKLKNADRSRLEGVSRTLIDGPEWFCHYDPDVPEAVRYHESTLPKTLVCHDMANGYHDDCMIDGTCNYDAYTFYNWAGVDIFCYFSHHLITIPPLAWINVGHDHGVKVIGTVITEWAEGIEFWDEILESEEVYKNFANALVTIAKTLKFDGWLLNIENKIAKPDMLLDFVKYLHQLLHQELPQAVLVWYDSVTVDGHLNWQNGLNNKNKVFFDACDAFFTNYSWTPDDVEASARAAGERLADLFIGIDVWGRNFYGGGQFNIQEAVDLAHMHGCSLAIFAPAWTHEALTLEKSDINLVALADELDPYEHFLLRDRALWDSIWRYLNTRLPCQLPFKTSFCRGQGLTRRLYGEVICPGSWFNLRHMQYQPNSSHGPHGYLLSTLENILSASRTGILKDPKGMIKYRGNSRELDLQETSIVPRADSIGEENKSFPDNQQTPPEETKEETKTPPEETKTKSQANHISFEPPPDNALESTTQPTMKTKMKNIFKHIFRHSRSRKEVNQTIINRENTESNLTKTNDAREPGTMRAGESEAKVNENKLEAIPEQNSEMDMKIIESKDTIEAESKTGIQIEASREFRYKSRSEEQLSKKTPSVAPIDDSDSDSDGPVVSTGRSMVRMSVNIQLKTKDDKTRYGLAHVPDELPCLEVLYEDSFIGGSCLKINPSDPHSRDHRQIKILQCDFPCEDSLIFCVVTKHVVAYEEQFLNLKVFLTDAAGDETELVLIGRDVPQALHSARSAGCIRTVAPVCPAVSGERFREMQKYILLNQPGFYVPVENSFGWVVRYYEVTLPGCRVASINCDTGLSHGPILLGYLGICQRHREDTDE